MALQPLHDRVLVRRLDSNEMTPGGIIIPDAAKEKPAEGIIVAAGDGARNQSGGRVQLDVKIGDMVLFSKFGGTEVTVNGEELVMLREADVMAVIEPASKKAKIAKPKSNKKKAAKAKTVKAKAKPKKK